MKNYLIITALVLFTQFVNASQIDNIAPSAEDVTPLLNGQKIPEVTLFDTDGKAVNLKQLTSEKPSVLLFYRGGWCPYCSAQLAGLRDIEQKVINMGYQLIAISPDSPERLNMQKVDNKYQVTLLSDKNFDAISAFGIGFFLPEKTANKYRSKLGVEFVALDGSSKVALPVPAVYVVDREGLIHFNYVNPNFRVRLSPELLYQATKTLAL